MFKTLTTVSIMFVALLVSSCGGTISNTITDDRKTPIFAEFINCNGESSSEPIEGCESFFASGIGYVNFSPEYCQIVEDVVICVSPNVAITFEDQNKVVGFIVDPVVDYEVCMNREIDDIETQAILVYTQSESPCQEVIGNVGCAYKFDVDSDPDNLFFTTISPLLTIHEQAHIKFDDPHGFCDEGFIDSACPSGDPICVEGLPSCREDVPSRYNQFSVCRSEINEVYRDGVFDYINEQREFGMDVI